MRRVQWRHARVGVGGDERSYEAGAGEVAGFVVGGESEGPSRRPGHAPHQEGGHVRNRVVTSKYTVVSFLPKGLWLQFRKVSNMYFLVFAALAYWREVSPYSPLGSTLALVFVVGVALVKELAEDVKRHRADGEVDSRVTRRLTLAVGHSNAGPTGTDVAADAGRSAEAPGSSFAEGGSGGGGAFGTEGGGSGGIDMFSVELCANGWEECRWDQVTVGDVVEVRDNEEFPADMVLLQTSLPSGTAYVSTMSLDGETNLKVRNVPRCQVLAATSTGGSLRGVLSGLAVHVENPCAALHSLRGYIEGGSPVEDAPLAIDNVLLRGSQLKNTGAVRGLVVYTGTDLRIAMNQRKTPAKSSTFEKFLNIQLLIMIALQLLLSLLGGALLTAWQYAHLDSWYLRFDLLDDSRGMVFFKGFMTYWILLGYLVPISLFVTLEVAKGIQGALMQRDLFMFDPLYSGEPMRARTSELNEDLGKVDVLFSDKTGTLTCNEMRLRALCLANGDAFGGRPGYRIEVDHGGMGALARFDPRLVHADYAPFLEAIALCHTCVVEESLRQWATIPSIPTPRKSVASASAGTGLLARTWSNGSARASKYLAKLARSASSAPGSSSGSVLLRSKTSTTPSGLSTPGTLATPVSHPSPGTSTSTGEDMIDGAVTVDIPLDEGDFGPFSYPGPASLPGPFDSPSATPSPSPSSNVLAASSTLATDLQQPPRLKYCGPSPDDVALVSAAATLGFSFGGRPRSNEIACHFLGRGARHYLLLATIDFTSARKRMSVAVRNLHDPSGRVTVHTKGADSVMFERLHRKDGGDQATAKARARASESIDAFSGEGLRTLLYASRELGASEWADWHARYERARAAGDREFGKAEQERRLAALEDELESDLTLRGGVGVEDKLQVGVKGALEKLLQAGIAVWVITGDKRETALAISTRTGLLRHAAAGADGRVRRLDLCKVAEKCGASPRAARASFLLEALRRGVQEADEFLGAPPRRPQRPRQWWRGWPWTTRAGGGGDGGEVPPSSGAGSGGGVDPPLGTGGALELVVDGQALDLVLGDAGVAPAGGGGRGAGGARAARERPWRTRCVQWWAAVWARRRWGRPGGRPPDAGDEVSEARRLFFEIAMRCTAVVCCRASPKEKALVVRMARQHRPGATTMAVGDGANDIGMIQEAHIGVGIFGKEGRGAINASDYALGQFRFLQRLLLYHGRLNHRRIARLIKYSFYKNCIVGFALFLFTLQAGCSGQALVSAVPISLYNTLFSSLPIFVFCLTDRDLKFGTVLAHPEVYRQHKSLSTRSFWMAISVSLLHAIVCLYLPQSSYSGTAATSPFGKLGGLDATGAVTYTAILLVVTAEIALVVRRWDPVILAACLFGPLAWFLLFPIYPLVGWSWFGALDPFVYGVASFLYGQGTFWCTLLVTTLACFLPRLAYRAIKWNFWPDHDALLREQEDMWKRARAQPRPPATATATSTGQRRHAPGDHGHEATPCPPSES